MTDSSSGKLDVEDARNDFNPKTPDRQLSPADLTALHVDDGEKVDSGPAVAIVAGQLTNDQLPTTHSDQADDATASELKSDAVSEPSPTGISLGAEIKSAGDSGRFSFDNASDCQATERTLLSDSLQLNDRAEQRAADAMESLSQAAAGGAEGGSAPFGSPVHIRPTGSPHRPLSLLGAGSRLHVDDEAMTSASFESPTEAATATATAAAATTAISSDSEEISAQPRGMSATEDLASRPLTLGILGGDSARGLADGEESDWGSLEDPYPLTPASNDVLHDNLNLEQSTTSMAGDYADSPLTNGAAHESAEEHLQKALARIVHLENQNVALYQTMQHDGSDETSEPSNSPTAAEADKLSAGGSGRLGGGNQRGKLKRMAGMFSQAAMDAKDGELQELHQKCMQFEIEVEKDLEDLTGQLFKAQQQVHVLQQSLTGSEAKRLQMQSAKQMVEAQLQVTGQQLMECEALLIQAGRDRPAKMTPPKKDGKATPTRGDGGTPAESPGTPVLRAVRSGHPFFNSLLETEVEQLKEENEALMTELVGKKMELAQQSEKFDRVKRDLLRQEARQSTKLSKMYAILGRNS